MRLIYLPIIALMIGATPAIAGTDSSEAPNPFTDPSAGQPSTANPIEGTGIDPTPASGILPAPAGDVTAAPGEQSGNSGTSTPFYQASKKDTGVQ